MMERTNGLRPVHFLKISHHGSKNGTPRRQLVKVLPERDPDGKPRFAVVSTREGAYAGVPDADTLSLVARDVILCLLHQLQRPAEVDRLLTVIERIEGDIATLASRDILLAEATFGEFRKSPQLAGRLADKVFEQIELGRWVSVRRALAAQAIEGLSSPILGPKISDKLRQWFPRWHSYGLSQTFQTIANWPDDPLIEPVLWRALHDEFYEAAPARIGGMNTHKLNLPIKFHACEMLG